MKTLINNMIESGRLTREEELRFDAIDAIFDYLHQQINSSMWSKIGCFDIEGLQDVWFTLTDPEQHPATGGSLLTYVGTLFQYAKVGQLTVPTGGGFYSVAHILKGAIGDTVYLNDPNEGYVINEDLLFQPEPEEYCVILSQVLAKIVTDNVMVHGVLMLHFHSQFVRLGLVDYPQLDV